MNRTVLLALIAVTVGSAFPTGAVAEPVRCYPKSALFPDAVTRLRGDVDGDGRADLVRTIPNWADSETCRARLIVKSARGVLTRRIDPLTGLLIAPPGLAGLVDLDRRPGLEIGVVVWLGASTGFADVYGVRGPELVRVNREAFDYGGSLVHREGVDCVHERSALVVGSHAVYRLSDNRYHAPARSWPSAVAFCSLYRC